MESAIATGGTFRPQPPRSPIFVLVAHYQGESSTPEVLAAYREKREAEHVASLIEKCVPSKAVAVQACDLIGYEIQVGMLR